MDPIKKFEATVFKELNSNRKMLFRTWTFTDSLFYSITILTTIGYSNNTPNTSIGKMATILYTTFGIPLMLMFICNLGLMLSHLIQFGYTSRNVALCTNEVASSSRINMYSEGSQILKQDTVVSLNLDSTSNSSTSDIRHIVLSEKQHLKPNPVSKYETLKRQKECSICDQCSDFEVNCQLCREDIHFQITEQKMNTIVHGNVTNQDLQYAHYNFCFPATLILLILFTYICIGALIYSVWKNQTFADGAYFCFLSLTTIGSCDMFRNFFTGTSETIEFLFYSFYLFIGLTFASSFIILIQRNVKIKTNSIRILKFRRQNDEVAL